MTTLTSSTKKHPCGGVFLFLLFRDAKFDAFELANGDVFASFGDAIFDELLDGF